MRTYETCPGRNIREVVASAIERAVLHGEPVCFTFNGEEIVVQPTDTVEAVYAAWKRRLDEAHAAWEASPKGQAAAREQKAHEERAAAFVAKGYASFDRIDPFVWVEGIIAQKGGQYGLACYRYAAQWAALMDAAMAAGETVEACADHCSREANVEGITGFMYGAAVGILAKCWRHGERLRCWHNLKTQIGNEGRRANAEGGVLNPALLSIGEP